MKFACWKCGKSFTVTDPHEPLHCPFCGAQVPLDLATTHVAEAYQALSAGRTDLARTAISRALAENDQYAPAYIARLVMRAGLKSEVELGTLKRSLVNDADYQKACALADEHYLLTLKSLEARIQENASGPEKERKYQEARRAQQAHQYEAATRLYAALGDYMDSLARKDECREIYDVEEQYASAQRAERSRDFAGALALYQAIGTYRDAHERSERIKSYLAGREAEAKGDWGRACTLYESLATFADAPARLAIARTKREEARQDIIYRGWVDKNYQARNEVYLKQAIKELNAIKDYKDAKVWVTRYQEYLEEKSQRRMPLLYIILAGIALMIVVVIVYFVTK